MVARALALFRMTPSPDERPCFVPVTPQTPPTSTRSKQHAVQSPIGDLNDRPRLRARNQS